MKRITFILALIIFSSLVLFAQNRNTRIFAIFTSRGCGCTGSGGAPLTFTTNDQVLSALQQECNGVDFIVWEGTRSAAYDEIQRCENLNRSA